MERQLVLATGNEHKKREVSAMLRHVEIVTPADLGLDFDYEETGDTYLSNAMGKARALHTLLASTVGPRPVLADDSGLSVVALGGRPGIHSARYGAAEGGNLLTASQKNERLLLEMKNISDRSAFYVCCMVLLADEYRFFVAQETWKGEITRQPSRATGGFGYDPVFLIAAEGKTAADLTESEKNERSHRGKALRSILPHIDGL